MREARMLSRGRRMLKEQYGWRWVAPFPLCDWPTQKSVATTDLTSHTGCSFQARQTEMAGRSGQGKQN
jgi:hypothetical protein